MNELGAPIIDAERFDPGTLAHVFATEERDMKISEEAMSISKGAQVLVSPPKEARKIAREALQVRASLPPSRRGGLDKSKAASLGIYSGVKQAEDIAAGKPIEAMRVHRFFSRFKGTIEDAEFAGRSMANSKMLQAAALWGGFPMWQAAKAVLGKR